jgi:hypothetical protein
MGWFKVVDQGVKGHVYRHGNERMAFNKHGNANYWSDFIHGGITQTFPTVEDAMRWLWKNNGSVQKSSSSEKPALTGKDEVPYSGIDYKKWYNTKLPNIPKNAFIILKSPDSNTVKGLGFKQKIDSTDAPAFKVVYEKPDTKEKAYFFTSGRGAYWQGEDGPHYFDTVKELMQFLWDKYSPNIQ